MAQAVEHILRKTLADARVEEMRAAMQHPAVRQAAARVDKIAQTGDVIGLRASCQAWNKAWIKALREMRALPEKTPAQVQQADEEDITS